MRVKLAEIGSELPLRYAVPFVAIIYAIGLYGFYQVCPAGSECGAGEEPFTFLNNALRTFGLFFSLAEPGHEALRNVWLMTARWIAPGITLFAIFRLFADRLVAWRKRLQLKGLKDHHLLVGLGESARHLLASSHPIVVIDRLAEVFAGTSFASPKFSITGDGREIGVLNAARVAHAHSMLIMGGSDSENLDIVSCVSKLRGATQEKLRVAVRLKSASLVTQLNKEDSFVGAENLDVTAFTLDQIAARVFLAEHSLSEMAHLRALTHIHLVIFGWSDFASASLLQFLRISPYAELSVPRMSIVCQNASEVLRRIQQQFPALADHSIALLKAFDISDVPTEFHLAEIEKPDPVTAVLIAHEEDEKNAVAALSLRQLTHISNRWLAPIFARLKSSAAIETMMSEKFGAQIDPTHEIIAVGQTSKSMSFENVFGLRDDLAKHFHDAYLQDHPSTSAATQEWNRLPATYRNANIAATDHSAARIMSAGYVIAEDTHMPHGNWQIVEHSSEMEKLAELIHKAWVIDRRLDGWRFGKTRDNQKLIHPSLRPYGELSDDVKDYDRAQIRLLTKVLQRGDRPTTVFKDCIVAGLGHNALSAAEVADIGTATNIAMAGIVAEHVTLVSPLAPGSDSVIIDAALDVLISKKIPFRLLVLHALPWTTVREEHVSAHNADAALLDAARSTILQKAGAAAQIIHLEPSGVSDEEWAKKPALRIAAYRKANQWMLERAQHVLCHLRDGQKALPGGTAEAFAQFKKTSAKIHRV